jgi:phenylacetic acid degradation operon negative regulatory protein
VLDVILAGLREQPSRTGKLIITLYGDAIAPRGGSLWLGTLLEVFRAAGVGDGVVRTACSRLAADGWLARCRRGRNSFYALAGRGLAETDAAAPRIYGPLSPPWDGVLTIAVLDPGPLRDPVREALFAAGWGAVGPLLMVGTAPVAAPGALVFTAAGDASTARELARRAWPLDELAERYHAFLAIFPEGEPPLTGLEALIARMLLVHEYRRVVLRDPHLPSALLPPDWPGFAARDRATALYAALHDASEAWLDAHAVAEAGALPRLDPARARRFA